MADLILSLPSKPSVSVTERRSERQSVTQTARTITIAPPQRMARPLNYQPGDILEYRPGPETGSDA